MFAAAAGSVGIAIQRLATLYDTVKSTKRLRFRVECAGHFIVWESQRKVLSHIFKEWIKHGSVAGFEKGEFFVDTEGNLLPCGDRVFGPDGVAIDACAVEQAPRR